MGENGQWAKVQNAKMTLPLFDYHGVKQNHLFESLIELLQLSCQIWI